MVLLSEPRIFDLDMQLISDIIFIIFALVFLAAVFLGLAMLIKLFIKILREN